MKRTTRLSTKRLPPPNSSDEGEPKKTNSKSKPRKKCTPPLKKQNQDGPSGDSSSESDIENYLKPADQIDLDSSFFKNEKAEGSFAAIEDDIFAGINRLSDSESESEPVDQVIPTSISKTTQIESEQPKPTTSKVNFQQLHDYTKKLEEAKRLVEKYEAGKRAKQKQLQEKKSDDISDLLALGEAKLESSTEFQTSIHSSDYDSCSESEREDWEEVEQHEIKESKDEMVAKDVQITVALPEVMRKKKGIDLVACMKRRLNRIRKENQVLVHKVHLLCWMAHGNYLNKVLNSESLLGMALSLIPSQHCYPPERTDLNYLEQIVKWYKNMMSIVDKLISKNVTLEKALKIQINRKQAYNKKMFVYIFICILRSLGIQCRLILSFQVAPLRPPTSELHSLSTKSDDKKDKNQKGTSSKTAESQDTNTEVKEDTVSKTKIKVDKKLAKKDGKLKHSNSENLDSKDVNSKQENEAQKTKQASRKPNLQSISSAAKKTRKSTSELDKMSQTEKESKNKNKPSTNLKEQSADRTSGRKKSTTDLLQVSQKAKSEEKSRNRSKSANETSSQSKTRKLDLQKLKPTIKSKSTSKLNDEIKTKKGNTNNNQSESAKLIIPQTDGANDSDDEPSTSSKATKIDLKKLLQEEANPCPKKHPKRLKSLPNYAEENSDEDFQCESPRKKSNEPMKRKSANLKKLNTPPKLPSNKEISNRPLTRNDKNPKPNSTANLKKLKQRKSANSSPSKPVFKNASEYIASLTPKKKGGIRDDIISIMKGAIAQDKAAARSKAVKSRKSRIASDNDSDYAPEPLKKKHHDSDDEFYEKTKIKVKQRVKVKKEDADEEEAKKKKGVDVWVEVFLENEGKWISADVIKGQVHCVSELYSRASHPVTYIVAWNNDNSIKDITQRYCSNWNTVTRKLRIDKNWWEDTLKPFRCRTTALDKEEDEELARLQLEKPLPNTISEYKNHPLYALKRHLLKFEAIYPPDAVTLGFVRKEAVYSRDCIHVLHSREIWLKHAKVVKPGEQPYKIVKARPKYDRLSGKIVTDLPLEVFGKWQIEDYVPPTAENGIVPRNAYGNVELFKACMLPKGTVHLQLPGLNKVAKKMNLDCAPAMVGFDFHAGWSHPMFDGFVVCEEHSDVLVAAWHMEQEEQEKREQEKFEKRVYGNWKKLIKGLLIRERLKKRYNFGQPSEAETAGNKRKSKGPKVVSKKRRLCSDSESDVNDDN